GNVPTRLARLEEGRFDAVVVAAAGLKRLNLIDRATELLGEEVMLPAPGQGIVAVQIREGDAATAASGRARRATASRSAGAGRGTRSWRPSKGDASYRWARARAPRMGR